MGRGQKFCNSCGAANGPRSFLCKACNAPFFIKGEIGEPKHIKIKKEITNNGDDTIPDFNWRELQSGDRIKVYKGYGPAWLSEIPNEDGTDNYICLSDPGIFIVERLDRQGIHCYNIKDRSHGHYYIYMGDAGPSPIDPRLYRRPHKIRKLRKKVDKYGNPSTII